MSKEDSSNEVMLSTLIKEVRDSRKETLESLTSLRVDFDKKFERVFESLEDEKITNAEQNILIKQLKEGLKEIKLELDCHIKKDDNQLEELYTNRTKNKIGWAAVIFISIYLMNLLTDFAKSKFGF